MSLPRILVASPTSIDKDYCFDGWADMVRGFDYPRYSVVMVDNSPKKHNYYRKIQEKGFNAGWVDRSGKLAEQYLCESQEAIRHYFLKSGYDYLLMLESDVFVPKDTLSYMAMHREAVYNMTYFVNLERNNFETSLCLQVKMNRNGNMRTRMVTPEESAALSGRKGMMMDMKIGDASVSQSGIGCTMIAKEVAAMIPFRWVNEYKNPMGEVVRNKYFSDTLFHLDVNNKGIRNVLDTTRICEHRRSSGWTYN